MRRGPVLVLGAGVSGLSAGLLLVRAGWSVTVRAEEPPLRTTSAAAAAVWYPYKAAPEGRVLEWGRRTFADLLDLAENEPAAGVRLRDGLELFRRPVPDPWWRDAVRSYRRADAAELPPGYRGGYFFRSPVVEMPTYLPYLLDRFRDGGGRFEVGRVESLQAALAVCPVVVNCTGLGSRGLLGDEDVRPVRGQVVRVSNPGLDRFLIDEESLTYVVPRRTDCILGGTAEEGRWDTQPDPATAADILRRCQALEPRLSGAAVLEHRVGLRPCRSAVRLEREDRPGGVVVHNYGHGGSGVTLSWGCAREAVSLLEAGAFP